MMKNVRSVLTLPKTASMKMKKSARGGVGHVPRSPSLDLPLRKRYQRIGTSMNIWLNEFS